MDLGAGSVMPSSAEPTGAVALPLASAGSSGQQPSEYQSLLGNIEIPEGVDPSFLAALPEDMRQEVIAEQLRLQRLRQCARAQTTDTTTQVYNTLNQPIFKTCVIQSTLFTAGRFGSECRVLGGSSTKHSGRGACPTASRTAAHCCSC